MTTPAIGLVKPPVDPVDEAFIRELMACPPHLSVAEHTSRVVREFRRNAEERGAALRRVECLEYRACLKEVLADSKTETDHGGLTTVDELHVENLLHRWKAST